MEEEGGGDRGTLHDIGAFSLAERLDLLEFETTDQGTHARAGYLLLREFKTVRADRRCGPSPPPAVAERRGERVDGRLSRKSATSSTSRPDGGSPAKRPAGPGPNPRDPRVDP